MKHVSRDNLIAKMKKNGFTGPFAGGKHQFMKKESLKVRIPNPHQGDISSGLLIRILKQAEISKEQWDVL
ncbi:MAG: type II toxin-antitoxin system HicA family toxin [Bacteroidia bacterium]|nr:type II toxin-antitoxin system HicA family toxin [Bacteroidia bacterium]